MLESLIRQKKSILLIFGELHPEKRAKMANNGPKQLIWAKVGQLVYIDPPLMWRIVGLNSIYDLKGLHP